MLSSKPAAEGKQEHTRTPVDPVDEVYLVVRVARGDRRAFEALYRCYFPRLRRFLERVTRRPQIVEEILNDTMLVVWRKAATYNLQSKVSTWIFAIAYRKALKALKQVDDPLEFGIEEGAPTVWSLPERSTMQAELRAAMNRALGSLSPDHRTVVELTYYEGYAYREIAEIMGCPVDTVKTRMFHARRKLKLLFADRAGDVL
jgi:RNA polymerase sigma-70 factor (ECF subfamily)